MWSENPIAKKCNVRFPLIQTPLAPFTYQQDILTSASKMNSIDHISLYAGLNSPLIANLFANKIIPHLIEQTVIAIQRLSMQINEYKEKKHE